jgi:hypothetical protein
MVTSIGISGGVKHTVHSSNKLADGNFVPGWFLPEDAER